MTETPLLMPVQVNNSESFCFVLWSDASGNKTSLTYYDFVSRNKTIHRFSVLIRVTGELEPIPAHWIGFVWVFFNCKTTSSHFLYDLNSFFKGAAIFSVGWIFLWSHLRIITTELLSKSQVPSWISWHDSWHWRPWPCRPCALTPTQTLLAKSNPMPLPVCHPSPSQNIPEGTIYLLVSVYPRSGFPPLSLARLQRRHGTVPKYDIHLPKHRKKHTKYTKQPSAI